MDPQSASACTSIESSPRPLSSSSVESNEDHAIDESRTLFLGDLPSSATVEQISDLFSDLQVSHVEIKIINSAKGTLCYSFVSFSSADYCQRAFDKYDGNQALFPDGSVVRVGWAKRNSRLHVSNLDENTTEKDLIDLFTKYGELSAVDGILVIKKPSSNPQIQHQTVCYGVVNFDQRDAAEIAKNALHNTYFGGRRLRVEWNRASRKSVVTRFPTEEAAAADPLHYASHSPVISIYVQFETLDTESTVNEALIAEVFEPFGHMTGCFIKTNNTSVSGLRQHGYAFVHFDNSYDGKKSALAAASISKECPYEHQGVLFHAEISKNFKKATSNTSQSSYNFKHNYYANNHDDETFSHVTDETYGESYKSGKSEYSGVTSNVTTPGATYYYPPNVQYMMPYNSNMMYQPMQYQTPYNSSYSPGGTNTEFNENSAMFYVKQPYHMNYQPHVAQISPHHGHISSYMTANPMSMKNMPERSYPHPAADPSPIPAALQLPMPYNTGAMGMIPSSPTVSTGNNTPRYYPHSSSSSSSVSVTGNWQQSQQQQLQLQQQLQQHM